MAPAIFRQIRYTAYGEIRGRFNSAGNPATFSEDARFEFTGYETDFAGLDYAGARFFDPELAQFGSHDPAGQYASPYAYGPGDPVNGTDPGGADFLEDLAADITGRAVQAGVQATVAFIDTYRQTGSARAGVSAAGHGAANGATNGAYGLVKAISNDDAGRYLLDAYANALTFGIYGTVRSFKRGDIAAGLVGAAASAAAIAQLAFGRYTSRANSGTVSGNDFASQASGTVASTGDSTTDGEEVFDAALAEAKDKGLVSQEFNPRFDPKIRMVMDGPQGRAEVVVDSFDEAAVFERLGFSNRRGYESGGAVTIFGGALRTSGRVGIFKFTFASPQDAVLATIVHEYGHSLTIGGQHVMGEGAARALGFGAVGIQYP